MQFDLSPQMRGQFFIWNVKIIRYLPCGTKMCNKIDLRLYTFYFKDVPTTYLLPTYIYLRLCFILGWPRGQPRPNVTTEDVFFSPEFQGFWKKKFKKKKSKKNFWKKNLNFFLHPRVSFFFTGILPRRDQNSGFLKKKLKKYFF